MSKEAELAALIQSTQEFDPSESPISITPGLADWMLAHALSLAFTSYQTGQLILAGVAPNGRLSFSEQNYARATGLAYHRGRLFVGSMFQVWRLENMLKPGQYANGAYDCVLVPRQAQTVNYLDVHEMAVDGRDRLIFVNSRFSCLAEFDERHSFRPIWKPPFVSALAPEDRCHLNGMAMENGRPAYVTALGAADSKEGWRKSRSTGGVLIEVTSGETVAEGLSMPHSPRVHQGQIWALDSGRGWIVRIEPGSGRIEDVAFCPGFLRGLAFVEGHAIVTVSKARDGSFGDLPLQKELNSRGLEPQCGVLIVDLQTGQVMQSILFEGRITELFDIALLAGIRNPMSIGPATTDMIGSVSFENSFGALY